MGRTFITAEIGINAPKLQDKFRLIDSAKEAGVDAVKFQLWEQKTFPHLEEYRISKGDLCQTYGYASAAGIEWYCTAFDLESLEFVCNIGMDIFKIPSNPAVVKNIQMIDAIRDKVVENKRIFVSTGISDYFELCFINNRLDPYSAVFFHCVSQYPTSVDKLNLQNIKHLRRRFKNVGYSDHSGIPEIPALAVCLGAKYIECHITLDKKQEGPDHASSLDIDEFNRMVKLVRIAETAIGE